MQATHPQLPKKGENISMSTCYMQINAKFKLKTLKSIFVLSSSLAHSELMVTEQKQQNTYESTNWHGPLVQ